MHCGNAVPLGRDLVTSKWGSPHYGEITKSIPILPLQNHVTSLAYEWSLPAPQALVFLSHQIHHTPD